LGLAGLALPIEVTEFLSSTGRSRRKGIKARHHGHYRFRIFVAGRFFDITPRDNLGGGVYADVSSDDGIAVGLAGSSKNLMEILQLGSTIAGLFDYDFPVQSSSRGAMNINNNIGPGFMMTVEGYDAALGAMVGVTAMTIWGWAPICRPCRWICRFCCGAYEYPRHDRPRMLIESDGGDAAINIVADARANDNLGEGIISTRTANSEWPDGFPVHDPLRALASGLGEQFLGRRIDLPASVSDRWSRPGMEGMESRQR
jgi:hypothetical protein